MTAAPAGTGREVRLDRLRGAAIVLMIIDHVAAFVVRYSSDGTLDAVAGWVRRWPTRLSMPLFMLVSGTLLARHVPSVPRRAQVAVAAVAVNVAIVVCDPGIFAPEILATWTAVMVAADAVRTWPVAVAAAGVLWAFTWPVDWAGYQPGVIAAYLALGVLAARTGGSVTSAGGPLPRWLEPVGRRPLSIYVGHIAALCAAAVLWQVAR